MEKGKLREALGPSAADTSCLLSAIVTPILKGQLAISHDAGFRNVWTLTISHLEFPQLEIN